MFYGEMRSGLRFFVVQEALDVFGEDVGFVVDGVVDGHGVDIGVRVGEGDDGDVGDAVVPAGDGGADAVEGDWNLFRRRSGGDLGGRGRRATNFRLRGLGG